MTANDPRIRRDHRAEAKRLDERHNWAPLLWLAAFVVIVGVLLAVTR